MSNIEFKNVDPIEVAKDAIEVGEDVAVNPKGFWRTKKFWLDLVVGAAHIIKRKDKV